MLTLCYAGCEGWPELITLCSSAIGSTQSVILDFLFGFALALWFQWDHTKVQCFSKCSYSTYSVTSPDLEKNTEHCFSGLEIRKSLFFCSTMDGFAWCFLATP